MFFCSDEWSRSRNQLDSQNIAATAVRSRVKIAPTRESNIGLKCWAFQEEK
jgi:hypothetical protein